MRALSTLRSAAVAGALLVSVAAAARADDPAAPDLFKLVASAREKLDQGDAKGAAEVLTKAIEAAPKNASIRHERAVCRARLGDVKGVVEDLKQAAALEPKDYPVDVALWREAVDTAREQGRSKEPDLALIQAEVAAIRGKAFKGDVPSENQSAADFGAMVDASIEEESPSARRADINAGLHRLGLLPDAFDLKKAVTGALMSQAAAYYDPKKKKFFNLMGDMPTEFLEATAAHELVHALQDQYFDLDAWFKAHESPKTAGARDDDRTLALRCVVEGEATFVQTVWQLEQMMHVDETQALAMARATIPMTATMDVEQLAGMAKLAAALIPPDSAMGKAVAEMTKIEPYVMEPLLGAYMGGANLVQTVQAAGGWAAVDKLYADPPQSSEQCLHPEKYAKRRDLPTPVALPEIPEIAAAGWRAADLAVHGELYFKILLHREGATNADAQKAAAGWDGDVYGAWRDAAGRTAIVLATTWDTERDAREFFETYRSSLARKYGKVAEETGSTVDSFLYGCGDAALGTGALVHRGTEVFAAEGFAADLRAKVVAALLAVKIDRVQ